MIDREKLRSVVRRQRDGEDLLCLLDRAIDLLPAETLEEFIAGYARATDLQHDGSPPPALLDEVERFRVSSLRGDFFEVLEVKSKYYWMKSRGTQLWIAECHRLLEKCGVAAERGELASARKSFDVLFRLLAQIDRGTPNILSFMDEHGSEQVGIDWPTVLPRWFLCVAATCSADQYAKAVHQVISCFAHYASDELLPKALIVADEAQRAALNAMSPPARSYGPLDI